MVVKWSAWVMVLLDASEPHSVSGLCLVASHLPPLFYSLPLSLALLQAWVSLSLFTFHLSHSCFFTSLPLSWSPCDPLQACNQPRRWADRLGWLNVGRWGQNGQCWFRRWRIHGLVQVTSIKNSTDKKQQNMLFFLVIGGMKQVKLKEAKKIWPENQRRTWTPSQR